MNYLKILKHTACTLAAIAYFLFAIVTYVDGDRLMCGLCLVLSVQFLFHGLGWQDHVHTDNLPCQQGKPCLIIKHSQSENYDR